MKRISEVKKEVHHQEWLTMVQTCQNSGKPVNCKTLNIDRLHPKVEMSNNIAERTVKPFVICRKNFLFCDTEKGAEASATICTIIETANRNNLNPYEYLNYLLTILPTFGENPTVSQIKSVMPWSLAIPAVCRNPEL